VNVTLLIIGKHLVQLSQSHFVACWNIHEARVRLTIGINKDGGSWVGEAHDGFAGGTSHLAIGIVEASSTIDCNRSSFNIQQLVESCLIRIGTERKLPRFSVGRADSSVYRALVRDSS